MDPEGAVLRNWVARQRKAYWEAKNEERLKFEALTAKKRRVEEKVARREAKEQAKKSHREAKENAKKERKELKKRKRDEKDNATKEDDGEGGNEEGISKEGEGKNINREKKEENENEGGSKGEEEDLEEDDENDKTESEKSVSDAEESAEEEKKDPDKVPSSYSSKYVRGSGKTGRKSKKPARELLPHRIQALNKIGFIWSVGDTRWNKRLDELREYKSCHNDLAVPFQYKPNQSLAHWVHKQRREYKFWQEGKPSELTHERISQLEGLGFIWRSDFPRTQRTDRAEPRKLNEEEEWDECYNLLMQFHAQFGHTRVGCNHLRRSSYNLSKRLAAFVSWQRKQYKMFKKGQISTLTQERITHLNKLGFDWDGRKFGPRGPRKKNKQQDEDEMDNDENKVDGEKKVKQEEDDENEEGQEKQDVDEIEQGEDLVEKGASNDEEDDIFGEVVKVRGDGNQGHKEEDDGEDDPNEEIEDVEI